MIGLQKWWRIEKDKTGAILSCKEVEASETNSKLVCFVEAIDAAEAVQKAAEWYEKRRVHTANHTIKVRAAAKKAGLCRCGQREPIKGRKMCSVCTASAAKYNKRRRSGEPAKPIAPVTVAYKKHLKGAAEASRRQGGPLAYGLRRTLKRFDALGPKAFRAWLVSEIDRHVRRLNPDILAGTVKISPKKAIDWFEDRLAEAAE